MEIKEEKLETKRKKSYLAHRTQDNQECKYLYRGQSRMRQEVIDRLAQCVCKHQHIQLQSRDSCFGILVRKGDIHHMLSHCLLYLYQLI